MIADPGNRLPEPYAKKLWDDLKVAENLFVPFGFLLALLTPLLARKREQGRGLRRLWALGLGLSLVTVVGIGISIDYLRSYHLMFMYPFVAVALGGWAAVLAERVGPEVASRWSSDKVTGFARRWKASLVTFGLCWVGVATVLLVFADKNAVRPSEDHCTGGFKNTSTASSCRLVTNEVFADLPGPGARPVVVENLRQHEGGLDSAVSVALDLLVRGMHEERLRCCPEPTDPVWYWILQQDGIPADLGPVLPTLGDVDLLLDHSASNELVLAVRSDAGRVALGELLCGLLPPDALLSGRTYRTYLGSLLTPDCDAPPPPEPYPGCISERVIF
jgi:hypothetical protein